MLLLTLLLIPLVGIFTIAATPLYDSETRQEVEHTSYILSKEFITLNRIRLEKKIKFTALTTSIVNLAISLMIFITFDLSSNQFQFVQEYHHLSSFDLYLGIDGLSVYFVLLTTLIIPISLLSNWTSISENIKSFVNRDIIYQKYF